MSLGTSKLPGEYKVRFNTHYPSRSPYKWRLIHILEGVWKEVLCNEIMFQCHSCTSTDTLQDGVTIKHHISLVEPVHMMFDEKYDDGNYNKVTFL